MEKVISIKDAMQMCDNDRMFFEELVGIMREDVEVCLDLVAQAFRSKDSTQMRDVSHRVKGQAASMCANDLWKTSGKVEQSAKLGFLTRAEYLCMILSMKNFLRCTRSVRSRGD